MTQRHVSSFLSILKVEQLILKYHINFRTYLSSFQCHFQSFFVIFPPWWQFVIFGPFWLFLVLFTFFQMFFSDVSDVYSQFHSFRTDSRSTRQLQNAKPASLKIHCMRQRAYAKSNPVLTCSGWPSDSTRFIRKKKSVTKGLKEGRNLRGYGCHISVTAGRLVIKGSKKSQN